MREREQIQYVSSFFDCILKAVTAFYGHVRHFVFPSDRSNCNIKRFQFRRIKVFGNWIWPAKSLQKK